ncbi:unnamed protein product [Linum tenue]|uniref:Uncharacterized protein n=1 Tax=Linum tenue TaxID=586396 RepID=A0AAV0S439_9ROSI|nr:unnamed protein product [Linum tenue]
MPAPRFSKQLAGHRLDVSSPHLDAAPRPPPRRQLPPIGHSGASVSWPPQEEANSSAAAGGSPSLAAAGRSSPLYRCRY